jgi:CO/xanthine dehydrogenase Mo-binding subunit
VASLAALHPARVGDVPTPLVTILTHPADDAGAGQAPVADWDETCAGTVAGALAHAIADACRTRPRHVPMGSEAVLRVLAPEDGLDTQPALP